MPYDRAAAVAYARRWWNRYNPAYPALADDCANFISQVLAAGGLPQAPAPDRARGWWYRHRREGWSYSWTVSDALRRFLLAAGRGRAAPAAAALQPGDLVFYDWRGTGRFRHSAVVVGAGAGGEPLVAAHTFPAWERPWAYRDSPAYTTATVYLWLQVGDGAPAEA